MSGLYGADVEQLRRLAERFGEAATQLDEAASTLTSQIGAAQQWQGPDAGRFRGDWSGRHRGALLAAGNELRDAADALRRNADEQERASTDTGGGSIGSGGSDGSGSSDGGGGGGGGGGVGTWTTDGHVGWSGSGQGGFFEKPDTTGTVKPGRYGDEFFPNGVENLSREFTDKDVKTHLAGASASGVLGAEGSVQGEWGSADGWNASAGAEGWAGLRGDAGAGVYTDASGRYVAEAGASAAVGAGGSASASGGYGILEGNASANAFAGARAGVNGDVSWGPEGLGASLGAEAFAGAEASASVSGGITGAQVGATGEVYAGIGAKAKADFDIGLDRTQIDVELGAALGIGAGVSFKVDIQPKKVVDGVLGVFGF